jgi:hypothetical protein
MARLDDRQAEQSAGHEGGTEAYEATWRDFSNPELLKLQEVREQAMEPPGPTLSGQGRHSPRPRPRTPRANLSRPCSTTMRTRREAGNELPGRQGSEDASAGQSEKARVETCQRVTWAIQRGRPSGENPQVEDEPLMTEAEAARFLRVSVRTLKRWRLEGSEGPPVAGYVGRSPRYRRSELLAWIRRGKG